MHNPQKRQEAFNNGIKNSNAQAHQKAGGLP